MVVEHALLRVNETQKPAFEAAMIKAKPLIAASKGFISIEVKPASEEKGLYLLLVAWQTIADHKDGFRKSDRYQLWKDILHGFYDPMPTIKYFQESIV